MYSSEAANVGPRRLALTSLGVLALGLALMLSTGAAAHAATVSTVVDGVVYTATDTSPSNGAKITGCEATCGPNPTFHDQVTIDGATYDVRTIGTDAFSDHGALGIVTIPDSVTRIMNGAFLNAGVTSVHLGSGITTLGGSAFQNNPMEYLSIPDTVTSISSSAFFNTGLISVELGTGVRQIGELAFAANLNLTSVYLTSPAVNLAVYGTAFDVSDDMQFYFHWSLGKDAGVTGGYTTPEWEGFPAHAYANVSYETGAGTTIPAERVEYAEPMSAPAPPTLPDHALIGWFTDAALTVPYNFAEPVTSDLILYAGWALDSYTVSFDTSGAAAIAPVAVDLGSVLSVPEAPTKTGFTFTGWYSDAALSTTYDFMQPVMNDTTLYAGWVAQAQPTTAESTDGSAARLANTGDEGAVGLMCWSVLTLVLGAGLLASARVRGRKRKTLASE